MRVQTRIRSVSLLLALVMLVSMLAIPAMAAPAQKSITMSPVSVDSTTATITVTGFGTDSTGLLYVTDKGEAGMSDTLHALAFTSSFHGDGEYEVTFEQPLTEGTELLPYHRKYDYLTYQYVNTTGTPVTVTAAGTVDPEVPTAPVVAITEPVTTASSSLTVTITGTVPAEARLVVKSFAPDAAIASNQGDFVAAADAKAETTLSVQNLREGNRLAAFLIKGEVLAQSEPVVVAAEEVQPDPLSVAIQAPVSAGDASLTISIAGEIPSDAIVLVKSFAPDAAIASNQGTYVVSGGALAETTFSVTNLQEGNRLAAFLLLAGELLAQSEPVTIAAPAAPDPDIKPGTTPEEILANCSATLMKDGKERTETFRENETSTQVKVQLDPGIEKCYLTVFAYASNTAFDPDASHNIRLATQQVKNGDLVTMDFAPANLPLKVGYSVIACLNVPVGPDWYKPVNSKPLQIVDENGQGFEDYDPYPNAYINDQTLHAGATTLHLSLEADARLFQAAKEKKTSLNVAVRQYPDGSDFDFEAEDQITVYNATLCTEPINNQEITLTAPLKAGYRVRAVVYWEQNVELHLPKGNDYEAMFHRPDDSVLISGEPVQPEVKDFTVAVKSGLQEGSREAVFTVTANKALTGVINAVKLYKTTDLTTPVAQKFGQNPGDIALDLSNANLKAGDQVRLVLTYNNAESTFTSEPFTVEAAAPQVQDFTVAVKSGLQEGSREAVFTVTANKALTGVINAVKLFKTTDLTTPVVQKFGQNPGDIALDLSNANLKAGDQVQLVLIYNNAASTFTSEPFTVEAQPDVVVEPSITITDSVITEGDSNVNAVVTLDKSVSGAQYVLYQFVGETLDKTTATTLLKGNVYPSNPKISAYVLHKLVKGQNLQFVLTVNGQDYLSNVIAVSPAPDWGTPTIALDASAIFSDAASIPVISSYSDEYLSLGDAFFCDITLYQFSGNISEDQFIRNEWWENPSVSTRIGQLNSRSGDKTKGRLEVSLLEGVTLNPGSRIIAKLRLPHPEWEDAEQDFVSLSVPVVEPGTQILEPTVALLNLGTDTARGRQIRQILTELNYTVKTLENKDLDEYVGYVAGLPGYEKLPGDYTGYQYTTEFMLMCNLSEPQLDRLLQKMMDAKLQIGHKCMMTAGNKDMQVYELIDLIVDEHLEFTRGLLDNLTKEVDKLSEAQYGQHADWDKLQASNAAAKQLVANEKAKIAELEAALQELRGLYDSVTGDKPAEITYTPVAEVPATCTENGVKAHFVGSDNKLYVEQDGKKVEVTAEQLVIPAAHKLTPVAEVPATCTKNGVKAHYKCSVCGELFLDQNGKQPVTAEQLVIPAAHNLVYFKRIEPTYTTIGVRAHYYCTVCGRLFVEQNGKLVEVTALELILPRLSYKPTVPSKPLEPTYNLGSFVDVATNNWFYDDVEYVTRKGLMNGTSTFEFSPYMTTNRAMLVTILYRMAGAPRVTSDVSFTDVSRDAWYYPALCWAVQEGLAKGYDESTFGTTNAVTREDTATFLYRFMDYLNRRTVTGSLTGYDDASQVSDYAVDAMSWAVGSGLMKGRDADTLAPISTATRAELAALIHRFCEMN